MKRYKLIVRGKIIMPWKPTDEDLKIMDCFYESPAFALMRKPMYVTFLILHMTDFLRTINASVSRIHSNWFLLDESSENP